MRVILIALAAALSSSCGPSGLNDRQRNEVIDIAGDAAPPSVEESPKVQELEGQISELEEQVQALEQRLDDTESRLDDAGID